MKPGIPFVLAAAVAVTGCSSQAAGSPTATPAAQATLQPTPLTSTVEPRSTSVAVNNSPPHPKQPVKGTPYQKAQTYLQQHDYASAQQQFKAAIGQRQHVLEAYAGLGTADLSLRQYGAGYRAFKTAADHAPNNAAFLYNTAYAALFAHDYKSAVAYATRFIRLQPKNPNGYHLRLLAYGQLFQHRRQVTDARMIAQLQPRNAEAYNDLGIALTNDRQAAAAIEAFTKAIRLVPSNPTYYKNRAIAEVVTQQPKAALTDLEKARSLTRDPKVRRQLDPEIATLKKLTHR